MTYEIAIRADGSPALVASGRLSARKSPPRPRVVDAPGRSDDHDDDQRHDAPGRESP